MSGKNGGGGGGGAMNGVGLNGERKRWIHDPTSK